MNKNCIWKNLMVLSFFILPSLYLPAAPVLEPAVQSADSAVPAKPAADFTDDEGYKSMFLFMNVMQMLRDNYVDKDKISYQRLMRGAMKGMLGELDPFSAYESPEHYNRTVEDTKGEFGGLGIVVTTRNNLIEIVSPMENTPGEKAGLKAGDIIVEIDGKPTRIMQLGDAVDKLKGAPGSSVALTIFRKEDNSTKKIDVTRAIIEVSPVKGVKMLDNGIGYLEITQFSAPLSQKLDEAVSKLKKENMKGLIIDLRGNPGGLMSSAIEVASRFIKEGRLVVSTKGRNENDRQEFYSVSCDKTLDVPMVLLVDAMSASSSEIFAGCMQDYKRAVLIGEKTFGKAFVQTIVPLEDKGAIRFTTAKYFTPKNRLIHGVGISPDIPISISGIEEIKLISQRAQYPGVIKPDVAGTVKDVRLERAAEVLRGICLYNNMKSSE